MTLNEFRVEMASYRRCADDEAKVLKDPYVTLEKLRVLYGNFNDAERRMANQVLNEWTLSEDESVRFDALAMIDDLKLATAVPTLNKLGERLGTSTQPGAPYELKKIYRILFGLTMSGPSR